MLGNLTTSLSKVFNKLSGSQLLSDKNIEQALSEIKSSLIEADVALEVIENFLENVKQKVLKSKGNKNLTVSQQFVKIAHLELTNVLGNKENSLNLKAVPPAVIMVVGLQGVGKTTTISKIAYHLKTKEKKKVLLTSTDVYRAAAIEQLQLLAERNNIDFFSSSQKKPKKIAQSAKKFAIKNMYDVLLVDTAGRLHIDKYMMTEVSDIQKKIDPIESLFLVDAMMGQDAVNTAKAFAEKVNLTGIVLTKTDSEARAGVALSVLSIVKKPIKLMGTGEKITDLEVFHADRIASRLLGMGDMLTLIEDIEKKINLVEVKKTSKKIIKGVFDLSDMRGQLEQMRNMGGIESVISKIPNMSKYAQQIKNKSAEFDDKKITKMVAIINSMTKKERVFSKLIAKKSRKLRIAKGSGTDVIEVNKLLRQFEKMQKVMQKNSTNKMQNILKQFQNIPPPPNL